MLSTVMFGTLPTEIIVEILAFLDIPSLIALHLVSGSVKSLLDANESAIYRNAAMFHGFIASKDCPWNDIYSSRALRGVVDWKSLCQARLRINQAWRGQHPSTIRTFLPTQDDVHRLKVDERAGFVITTTVNGCITVSDLESGQTLWSLPEEYMVEFPHVEYENGFMIFNMRGQRKEVWRLVGSHADIPLVGADGQQQRQSDLSRAAHASTYPRGHFEAWCTLNTPTPTSAFRFVYPALLAATRRRLFLYDIPSGQLEKDFSITDPELDNQTIITYVELSQRHVFVCGYPSLRIVSRETGRVVLDIPSNNIRYSDSIHCLSKTMNVFPGSALGIHTDREYTPAYPSRIRQIYDQFAAVHVSPCGRHLAIIAMTSRLLFIPFFERLFSSHSPPIRLVDIVIEIELGSRGRLTRYLAYDGSRIAVATDTGIYIAHLPPLEEDGLGPNTALSMSRVVALDRPHALAEVSCLQMSDTALWLTWKSPYPEEEGEERVDFSAYLDEAIQYLEYEDPFGGVEIRHVEGQDDRVDATLRAVCMVDFARDNSA